MPISVAAEILMRELKDKFKFLKLIYVFFSQGFWGLDKKNSLPIMDVIMCENQGLSQMSNHHGMKIIVERQTGMQL